MCGERAAPHRIQLHGSPPTSFNPVEDFEQHEEDKEGHWE
jgi:hypothetical protein